MDAGTIRPVASGPQTAPARTPEPAGAVATTDLPAASAVQQDEESSASSDRDFRQEANDLPVASDDRRRTIERDAATGVTVMQFVERRSGEVVDQIPAESYLRMKVALQTILSSPSEMSHPVALNA